MHGCRTTLSGLLIVARGEVAVTCEETLTNAGTAHRSNPTIGLCGLGAEAFCEDCGWLVCPIHRIARHERHRMTPEERRSGEERRQG